MGPLDNEDNEVELFYIIMTNIDHIGPLLQTLSSVWLDCHFKIDQHCGFWLRLRSWKASYVHLSDILYGVHISVQFVTFDNTSIYTSLHSI